MIVVTDATPIIALAKIGQLSLIHTLFDSIVVPQAVFEEVAIPDKPGGDLIMESSWISVQQVQDIKRVAYLLHDLDKGEAEALVLAGELQADLLLMDEIKGRSVAEYLGINILGTIGVLLLAKRQGLIDTVRPHLDDLQSHRFRVSTKLVLAALKEAGE